MEGFNNMPSAYFDLCRDKKTGSVYQAALLLYILSEVDGKADGVAYLCHSDIKEACGIKDKRTWLKHIKRMQKEKLVEIEYGRNQYSHTRVMLQHFSSDTQPLCYSKNETMLQHLGRNTQPLCYSKNETMLQHLGRNTQPPCYSKNETMLQHLGRNTQPPCYSKNKPCYSTFSLEQSYTSSTGVSAWVFENHATALRPAGVCHATALRGKTAFEQNAYKTDKKIVNNFCERADKSIKKSHIINYINTYRSINNRILYIYNKKSVLSSIDSKRTMYFILNNSKINKNTPKIEIGACSATKTNGERERSAEGRKVSRGEIRQLKGAVLGAEWISEAVKSLGFKRDEFSVFVEEWEKRAEVTGKMRMYSPGSIRDFVIKDFLKLEERLVKAEAEVRIPVGMKIEGYFWSKEDKNRAVMQEREAIKYTITNAMRGDFFGSGYELYELIAANGHAKELEGGGENITAAVKKWLMLQSKNGLNVEKILQKIGF